MSWDWRAGASKIAPDSVSLLPERCVLALKFFEGHELQCNKPPKYTWRVTRVLEALAIAALLSMFAGVWMRWDALPDRYPTHFNAQGQPDKWGRKHGTLVLPAIASGVFLLLTAVSRLNPRFYNTPFPVDRDNPAVHAELRQMIVALKAVVMGMMAYIHHRAASVALGEASGLGGAFLVVVMFSIWPVLGYYLWRLNRHRR